MPSKRNSTTVLESGPDRGLFDGNGRVQRLARWLRDVPANPKVDLLALEIKDESGDYNRVQTWPRVNASSVLAPIIDAAVLDQANELGAYTSARVVWYISESNTPWTTQALRVHPDGMQGQQAFSGDSQSVNIQLQKTLQQVTALHLHSINDAMRLSSEGADDARMRASRSEDECAALRAENRELRARVVELEADNARATSEAEEALELAEEAQRNAASAKQGNEHQNAAIGLITQAVASMAKPPTPAS